jgi:hypothetical protein
MNTPALKLKTILLVFNLHMMRFDEDVHEHDDEIPNMNIQSSFHDLIKYQQLLDHH